MIDPTDAWKPFEATLDDPWDLRKAAHLHRRAGFCANWGQLQRDLKSGPAESIQRLLDPPDDDASFQQVSDAMLHAAGGSREADAFSSSSTSRRGAEWWLYRMAYGGDPLGEKLTLFWHNHFATALRGVYSMPLMLRQNATLRKGARGNFGELLAAIEADPAMLLWLDGGSNQKDHPNENFARELLELFTLGTGNFTENDVREAARGLTGWQEGRNNLLQRTKDFSYRDDLADVAPKTFLGRTGPWRTSDILRIILDHPVAAEHLCRRLYRWFIDETSEPDDELIQPLATEYRASNYSTQHVVGIMLRSRLFYSPACYRRRAKSPVEYCVGVIRQLEPVRSPNLLRLAARSCERQGQTLFDPPSVKGWDGGRAWLNSNTMLMRLNWTAELLDGNTRASIPKYDVETWMKTHEIRETSSADALCTLLVDNYLGDQTLHQIQALMESGDVSTKLSSALQLLLQSSEYQLA
jgi:uncharacterized protein (DUF1800 family)